MKKHVTLTVTALVLVVTAAAITLYSDIRKDVPNCAEFETMTNTGECINNDMLPPL